MDEEAWNLNYGPFLRVTPLNKTQRIEPAMVLTEEVRGLTQTHTDTGLQLIIMIIKGLVELFFK